MPILPHRPPITAPCARARAAAAIAIAGAIAAATSIATPAAVPAGADARRIESAVAGLWRDHPSPDAPAGANRYELLLRLDLDHAFTLYPPCASRAAATPATPASSPASPASHASPVSLALTSEPVARGVWRVTEGGALHLSGEHDGRHVELDVALRLQDDQLEVATPYGPGRLDHVAGQLPPACTNAR